MFKLVSKHLFWWPVAVKRPDPDEVGRFIRDEFEMQFEALPMDRARKIDEVRNALPADRRDERNFDFLFEVTKGWRDVEDEGGQSVPFTREIFETALQNAWFRDGVLAAYASAMAGQEARLGN